MQSGTMKNTDLFTQSACIATLTGLYKYGITDSGASFLSRSYDDHALLQHIFNNNEEKVVTAISDYGRQTYDNTFALMQSAAGAGLRFIRLQAANDLSLDRVKNILAGQRHHILACLPPDLQLGGLLNDNTIDDRTNKMEGPVSGFMHFVEGLFAPEEPKHR